MGDRDRRWNFISSVGAALVGAAALVIATAFTAAQEHHEFETTQRQAAYRTYVNALNSFEDVYQDARLAIESNRQANGKIRQQLEQALITVRGAKSAIDLIGTKAVQKQAVLSIGNYGDAKGDMISVLKRLASHPFDNRQQKLEDERTRETLDNLIGVAKQAFIDAGQRDLGLNCDAPLDPKCMWS